MENMKLKTCGYALQTSHTSASIFPHTIKCIFIAEARNEHTFNGRLMFPMNIKHQILFQEREFPKSKVDVDPNYIIPTIHGKEAAQYTAQDGSASSMTCKS